MCDTPSHNARRPLDFLTLDTIYEHMGVPRGTSLTLGAIAKFYKMNPRQLISWSTAAFRPRDLNESPACNCTWVQRRSFGWTGHDVTAPRKNENLPANAFRCSRGNSRHSHQLLMTYVSTCETAGQAPTLGLWGTRRSLSADTDVLALTALVPEWAPDAKIPVVLAVRHIWSDVVSGERAMHPLLKEPRQHICCMLHSVELSLPRAMIFTMARLAEGKKLLGVFNRQHAPYYSAEPTKESKKLEPPTFHGPTARALIRMYARCINYDERNETFTVSDPEHWPLRGIIDDNDPDLQHVLGAFY